MYVFEIRNGDVMEAIAKQAAVAGLRDGAIVSLIGGVDGFTMSTMPEDDATADVITGYELPAEMHGAGEIRDGVVHIHATMAVAGDRGLSGHLHSARVATHFARAYVLPA